MKIARLRNSGELELKNEIIEYPPELEGGRNLILNSGNLNLIGLYGVTGDRTIEQLNTSPTNEVWHLSNISRTVGNYVWRLNLQSIAPKFDEVDKEYTLSFYMKANTEQTMRALVNYGRVIKYSSTSVNNEYKHYSIVISRRLVDVATSHPCFISLIGDNLSDVYVYGIKLEKGSIATPWTPSPEELGLEYPEFIKSFKSKVYSNGVVLTPEIIEFPIELVGKRNLFSGKFYRDINNYDDVLVYRYHLTNLKSNKRYAVRSWLKDGETATSNFWITLTSGHPNPNNASANGGTYSHIINNGNTMNSQVLPRNDVPVYVSYYPPNADPSVLDRYNISIQQLDSGYIQEWTPAPYDLGVSYSEDIDSFGIRPFGDMTMVSELIEDCSFDDEEWERAETAYLDLYYYLKEKSGVFK